MEAARKVLTREALARRLAQERDSERRVVLCNGVFDLLHVGHLRVLEAAGALGDVLVVAVNDDDSVKRLKGPGRPVHSAEDRAELIAALGCVAWVTIFSEDTAAATLRALQPDVHAKGEDYDPSRMPEDERRAAQELDIELAFVGGPKLGSSSELWKRLTSLPSS